jgi:hypothetical protein
LRDYSCAMAVLRAPMDFVWMSLLQFDGYTFEPNFILCLTLGFFLSVPLDTRPTAGCSCSLLAKTCFGVAVGGTRVSHSTLGCSTGEQTTWSPGLHAERYCFVVRLFRYLYGRARSAVGSGVPVLSQAIYHVRLSWRRSHSLAVWGSPTRHARATLRRTRGSASGRESFHNPIRSWPSIWSQPGSSFSSCFISSRRAVSGAVHPGVHGLRGVHQHVYRRACRRPFLHRPGYGRASHSRASVI